MSFLITLFIKRSYYSIFIKKNIMRVQPLFFLRWHARASITALLSECKLCLYTENYCRGRTNTSLPANGIVLESPCAWPWGFVWPGPRDLSSGGAAACCYHPISGGVPIVSGYFLCDDGSCNIRLTSQSTGWILICLLTLH